ncbi:MAG: glycosyltransferase family 2 protein [Dermatophilaceae bacterium]|nr:glycosyltransferase family 2 protein [Dermatophilaceae bacterium]
MSAAHDGAADAGLLPLPAGVKAHSVVRPVVLTGILVIHNGAAWLQECLDALALQTRRLDRLVIVDTGSTDDSLRIAARHARIRQVIGDIATVSGSAGTTFGEAVGLAVAHLRGESASCSGDEGAEWLWLLHDDSAAATYSLAHLLDAARRSPSVGVAGPKLVSWDDPCRLLEVGWVITRSGRRVGGPARGERDQGQHDDRNDVLGVSTSGMLIRRDVFDELHGFDPAFGQFRDDLDLCWRAQLAGHRVVVAPSARMREVAASTTGLRSPDLSAETARRRDRRHGRQVALARCSLYAAPFLAIWIVLASVGSAVVLLLAKRPRVAWTELSDVGSVMTPWRPLAARWRSRGTRRVRRRDLRGLFATTQAGFGQTMDTIREGVLFGSARSGWSGGDAAAGSQTPESGPASEEAEQPEKPVRGTARILRHPGSLAVMAGVLLAAVSWRSLFGALSPSGLGLTGGELLAASGNASELWHGWLDGWHGAGLGNALESAPYLPVLAAGAWVLEQLPFIDLSASSVGVAIAWLLAVAIPLSAGTAYLGARVVTRAPWPRAWAGLAWASLATLTTAVAGGRLGAVVAHILLPVVAAGFVCAARRFASVPVIFGAALALGVTGAFNPALALLGALGSLVLLIVGRGRARLSALVLLLVPVGLLGPWIRQLVDNPLLLLSGPGLTVWHGPTAAPWQLELLHPGGPGSYPVLLSVPIVLAGLLAMSRREIGAPAMTVFAVLAASGLALGVASPHVIIGRIPQDLAGAGAPITVWPGTGLDLAALALIAAALRAYCRGPGRLSLSRPRLRKILVHAVAAAAVVGVMASMAMAGRLGVGEAVSPQQPRIPAVAADQAHGTWGNRLLALTRDPDTIGYRLVGAEPGPAARDLPGTVATPDPLLAAAVKSTVGDTDPSSTHAAHDRLADLGVGFVALHGTPADPLVSQLDATAGMTRLSNNRGLILWRVLPRGNGVSSSRLRLVDPLGAPLASIAVTGDHGRTVVAVGPAGAAGAATAAAGRRLVVAEPRAWAEHARVTFAGRRLEAIAGAAQPTYALPSTAGALSITLKPIQHRWRWAQLGLLLVVLFLAAPFGSTRPRGTP